MIGYVVPTLRKRERWGSPLVLDLTTEAKLETPG
jgi:hypothetical protein